MKIQQHRILNVALDETLLRSRSAILEEAGYKVVAALNLVDLRTACENESFDLVIIGYAIPKRERRRVMLAVRDVCGLAPILELYPHGTVPADQEAEEQLPSPGDAEKFLSKVREMLTRKRKRRKAAH